MLARHNRALSLFAMAVALSALAGCEEEKPLSAPLIRPIKTIVVKDVATDQVRRISGVLEANTVSDLSFEVPGQIIRLGFDVGDRLDKGAVIAELDPETYQLKLTTAVGELDSAKASLTNAKEKFTQQATLRQKGFATKTNYDTAVANLKTAESNLKIAETKFTIAERDLRKTKMIAPFRGRVSEKFVDVFQEMSAGAKILRLHTEGDLNVKISVPEGLIQKLSKGQRISVSFPSLEGLASFGAIIEIASAATSANAFAVKIALDRQFPELRPGIAAEVLIRYKTRDSGRAFRLPVTSVLPTGGEHATIYVFDSANGVVNARKVNVINVHNNELEVVGELKAGDVIAVAGVSFLADDMKVKLLDE